MPLSFHYFSLSLLIFAARFFIITLITTALYYAISLSPVSLLFIRFFIFIAAAYIIFTAPCRFARERASAATMQRQERACARAYARARLRGAAMRSSRYAPPPFIFADFRRYADFMFFATSHGFSPFSMTFTPPSLIIFAAHFHFADCCRLFSPRFYCHFMLRRHIFADFRCLFASATQPFRHYCHASATIFAIISPVLRLLRRLIFLSFRFRFAIFLRQPPLPLSPLFFIFIFIIISFA